jgi:hypothetical protein
VHVTNARKREAAVMGLEWDLKMEESRIRYKKHMTGKAYRMRESAYSMG